MHMNVRKATFQNEHYFLLCCLSYSLQLHLEYLGGYTETGERSKVHVVRGNHPVYAALVGLFSSITSGISYCLIRAGGKASDEPVYDHLLHLLIKSICMSSTCSS